MFKNTLFNFIELYNPLSTALVKDTNKDDFAYYRFELATTDLETTASYTLGAHHISIYETEEHYNPALSQYHYTAYLLDEQNDKYQLHIYFNEQNEIVGQSMLALKDSKSIWSDLDDELQKELIDLAQLYSMPIVNELKSKRFIEIQKIKENYNALNQEANRSSTFIDTKYQDYLNVLEQMIDTAELLISLGEIGYYEQEQKFIQKMKASIESEYQNNEVLDSSTENKQEDNYEFMIEEHSANKNRKTVPALVNPSSFNFDQLYQQLITKNDSLDASNKEAYTTGILELLAEINTVLLEKDLGVSEYHALNKLKQKIEKAGEQLFSRLILSGELHLLRKMPDFYRLIKATHLVYALQQGKHELLDFFLIHGVVDLNNQTIKFSERVVSLVQYCFHRDSQKTPMADCLAVLIKHNASLLAPTDEGGLPIAHVILSTPNHPLQKAFTAHIDVGNKTIFSSSFFKQLIAAMQQFLKQHQLSQVQVDELEQAITRYKSKEGAITLSPELVRINKLPAGMHLQQQMMHFAENHGKGILATLQQDPVVLLLIEQIKTAATEYIKKQPQLRMKQQTQLAADIFNKLEKLISSSGISFDEIENIKTLIINYLKDNHLLLTKRLDLLELQTQPQKKMYKSIHAQRKAQKEHEQQQREIIFEINVLEKKYDIAPAIEFSQIMEDMTSVFSNLANLLTELSNSINENRELFDDISKMVNTIVGNEAQGMQEPGNNEQLIASSSNYSRNTFFSANQNDNISNQHNKKKDKKKETAPSNKR